MISPEKEIRELRFKVRTLTNEKKQITGELVSCANELCMKCGNYSREHLGDCDGCRWLNVRKGIFDKNVPLKGCSL